MRSKWFKRAAKESSSAARRKPRRCGCESPKAPQIEPLEQRVLMSASPLGDAFLVNAAGVDSEVLTAADGSFVVVSQNGAGPGGHDLLFQRYDAAANSIGSATNINSTFPGIRWDAAMDDAGNFVVVWSHGTTELNVMMRRFDAQGNAVSEPTQVHAPSSNANQFSPAVAMDDDGDFVVAWLSDNEQRTLEIRHEPPTYFQDYIDEDNRVRRSVYDPSTYFLDLSYITTQVFARRFDAAGAAQGDQFQVSVQATAPNELRTSMHVAVAMDDDGDFAVGYSTFTYRTGKELISAAYEYSDIYYDYNDRPVELHRGKSAEYSYGLGDYPASGAVTFRRYDSAGAAQGGPVTVRSGASTTQVISGVAMAMDGDGDFVIGAGIDHFEKRTETYDGNTYTYLDLLFTQILARRYSLLGKPHGGVFEVARTLPGTFSLDGNVDMDDDGNFVVVWDQVLFDYELAEPDTPTGIFSRRYGSDGKLQGTTFMIDQGGLGSYPDVSVGATGNFTVSFYNEFSPTGVMARQFEPPKPDLIGTIGATTLANALVAGDGASGRVSVIVENIGDVMVSTPIDVELVASLDEVWGNDDDVPLTTLEDVSTRIAPGQSKTLSANVTIPVDTPEGQYRLLAFIDAANQVSTELQEDNNTAVGTALITVAEAFNDLIVAAPQHTLLPVMVPGDRGRLSTTVTNAGNIAIANELVNVHFFASTTGVLDGSEVLLASALNQKLSLRPGQGRNITASVTLDDSVAPDDYFIIAEVEPLSGLAESSTANNAAASVESSELAYRFGSFGERSNVKLLLTDGDGTQVTFSLSGPGFADVTDLGAAFDVQVSETSAASSVRITTGKDGDAAVGLNDITVGDAMTPADLKAFDARTADLLGNATFHGELSSLTLRHVADNHVITLGGETPAAMTFGMVQDLSIISTAPLKTLTAIQWLDGDADPDFIQAPSVGTLTIKGDRRANVAGDFEAGLQLSGAAEGDTLGTGKIAGAAAGLWNISGSASNISLGSTAPAWNAIVSGAVKSITTSGDLGGQLQALRLDRLAVKGNITGGSVNLLQAVDPALASLGSMRVTGAIENSTITTAGHMGALSAGALRNSSILAAVNTGVVGLPAASTDFADAAAIRSLSITGIRGDSGAAVIDSVVAAASLNSIRLGVVQLDNSATPFGLVGQSLTQIAYTRPDGVKVSIRSAQVPPDHIDDDLIVRVV